MVGTVVLVAIGLSIVSGVFVVRIAAPEKRRRVAVEEFGFPLIVLAALAVVPLTVWGHSFGGGWGALGGLVVGLGVLTCVAGWVEGD